MQKIKMHFVMVLADLRIHFGDETKYVKAKSQDAFPKAQDPKVLLDGMDKRKAMRESTTKGDPYQERSLRACFFFERCIRSSCTLQAFKGQH